MERPTDYRFATSHEWVKIEKGDIAVIGISDYAVKQLRDLVALDYPDLEQNLAKGEVFGEIESVKAASDMYSPIAGEVIELNTALEDDIDILTKDPFGEGWMLKLRVEDPSQIDDLLTPKAYEKHLAKS